MVDHQALAETAAHAAYEAAAAVFPKLLPDCHAFVEARKQAGGLGDITYPAKLIELAYWLTENQPKTVLEIGSGATSIILRKAPRYACLEEKQWGGTAERVLEDGRVRYRQTIPAAVSMLVEGGSLDLLYVDGPANSNPDGGQYICTDARDLVEHQIRPKNILVDLRCTSVADMWPVLKQAGYKAHPSPWTAQTFGLPWLCKKFWVHTWFYLKEESK